MKWLIWLNFWVQTLSRCEKVLGQTPESVYHFIYPGAGYGGSCFPKDVRALISTAHENDYSPSILEAVGAHNNRQKQKLLEIVIRHFGADLSDKQFAVWGLAFQSRTRTI